MFRTASTTTAQLYVSLFGSSHTMDLSNLEYQDVGVNCQPGRDERCTADEAKRYGNNKSHRSTTKRKIKNKLAKASKKINRKKG